jgi:hypothetical protein
MANGAAIALAGLFVGAGLALTGVVSELGKQSIDQQTEAACWIPQTTQGLNDLAKQEAMPSFKSSLDASLSQSDQDSITNSLVVTLGDYAFTGVSADRGTINCNAGLAYTYTRPDKSQFSSPGESVITYTVHPSQGGFLAEMSPSDIGIGTVAYTDNPNPPPPPPASPQPAPQAAVPPPEVADYDQGHADRLKYENWVNGLQGPESQGAIFWSGQRSLANPETCLSGASDAFPNDAASQTTFENGCQEAQDMLGPFDIKRNSDALYKAGWNAPVDAPPSGAPQTNN